ncbi:MAG: MATE family efflux transporter [Atopobiaceae bacterium]|jgi:putative MATE family efflux protein|nr:MATE family efflux transporter [Atopobiaceae bacterium]MCI2174035.1 MATE family efflux transporter [Atopobiaceae bacterium]MCI2207875.1 MATE family efflux transporter [Atopobiaceae bacterium]
MARERDLTQGAVLPTLVSFALPYLGASFLQALYGAVDLAVVGQFSGTSAISGVNIGSQLMQIVTAFVIGISMGTTVTLARHVGEGDEDASAACVGSSIVVFGILAVVLTPLLFLGAPMLVGWLQTPTEAFDQAVLYVRICACGIPFIVAFNVVAALLRGLGDSRTPLVFVGVACAVNVTGDLMLVGGLGLGVAGAAIATTAAQAIASVCGIVYLVRNGLPFRFDRHDVRLAATPTRAVTSVGMPIAAQDTLINISFILLTVIANERGLVASSAVGVTEKVITFMFLVPSAMLSAISALTAQNVGAGRPGRAVEAVRWGMAICAVFGACMCGLSQLMPDAICSVFSTDPAVVGQAGDYLRSYSIDCMLVSITFCLNGYLCGTGRSTVTFAHNTLSIFLVRIPCAVALSRAFPDSLLPMGLASPLGSVFSIAFLICFLAWDRRRPRRSRDGRTEG